MISKMLSSMKVLTCLFLIQLRLENVKTSIETGPRVQTTNGQVEGVHLDEANIFFGIPFAEPPVGENRWRAPVPSRSWGPKFVYKAVTPPPGCYQHCFLPPHTCPKTVSEDCLYLTVSTPHGVTEKSNLPVMVFLPGGQFIQGAGYTDLTDSRYFVNHTSTVMVLVNYRLGAFGFLVTGSGKDDATGNYAILDQRMAMEWVQANIASFGGDPTRVTLFGQSAGAQSVAVHLMSEKSDNLFHRAIIQSLPFGIPLKRDFEAVILGNCFAEGVMCRHGDMDCMRSKSSDEVLASQKLCEGMVVNPDALLESFEQWGPYLDGNDVKLQAIEGFRKGQYKKMPIIIGSTADETRINIFMAVTEPMTDIIEYYAILYAFFPSNFIDVLLEYPPAPPGSDQREALIRIANDFVFECPKRAALRSIAEHSQDGDWMYIFDHASSFNGWGQLWSFCDGYPCHGIDLPFLFHTVSRAGYQFTPDEDVLSRSMIYYWSNMAHTGNPNDNSWRTEMGKNTLTEGDQEFVNWPQYVNSTGWSYLRFMTPRDQVDRGDLDEKCAFWESLNVYP
ncbi:cAMP-regulated D2 protein-like [Ptychodera flava]|uniref:cAMP-regulated D2 protein-like n=1 Tax=Ptychodera flava TaxID=63121 RepID=UPI00396A69E9